MKSRENTSNGIGRRTFLAGASAAAGGAALAASATPVSAQEAVDLTGWLSNVSNVTGVVDRRGESTVAVSVGAPGNGGAFAFEPAVVRVDPGTAVVWEWTGAGGAHDVTDADGAYGSDMVGDAGATFEHAFSDPGVSRYACTPHEAMGMKGAVVVGDVPVTLPGDGAVADASDEAPAPPAPSEGHTYLSKEPPYGEWFDDVDNYAGTVDATGKSEVRIAVGSEGNGGGFAFDPPAVKVDPGTTVVWEWTGAGGSHNVVDADTDYESPLQSDEGATYALEFDGVGISRYACAPHEAMGMKGAVVVGDVGPGQTTLTAGEVGMLGGVGFAIGSPILFGLLLFLKGAFDEPDRDDVPVRDPVDPRRPA